QQHAAWLVLLFFEAVLVAKRQGLATDWTRRELWQHYELLWRNSERLAGNQLCAMPRRNDCPRRRRTRRQHPSDGLLFESWWASKRHRGSPYEFQREQLLRTGCLK